MDWKTATSVTSSTVYADYVPTSETALYSVAAGTTAKVSITLHNTDNSTARVVSLSIVKSGASAGTSNRIFTTYTLPAGTTLEVGERLVGPGDFISGIAVDASKVVASIDALVASAATGAVLAGIQDDAWGSGGRTATSGTVTGTNKVGTGNNRYLLAGLLVTATTGTVSYSSYDTLTMSCTDGAMTRLVSVDLNASGSLTGSVHLFGRANPTSSSTQTLTANVAEAGVTFNLTLASMSLSGVASVTGAATTGPSSAAALSLAVTSASGHRPFFIGGFNDVPMDLPRTVRVRAFDGNPAIGLAVPHWLVFADALGAGTVTATTSNSLIHCAAGIDLVPA